MYIVRFKAPSGSTVLLFFYSGNTVSSKAEDVHLMDALPSLAKCCLNWPSLRGWLVTLLTRHSWTIFPMQGQNNPMIMGCTEPMCPC